MEGRYIGRWEGGEVLRTVTGRVYVISKNIHGRRLRLSTRASTPARGQGGLPAFHPGPRQLPVGGSTTGAGAGSGPSPSRGGYHRCRFSPVRRSEGGM